MLRRLKSQYYFLYRVKVQECSRMKMRWWVEELGCFKAESMYDIDKCSNVVNSCNIIFMVGPHAAGLDLQMKYVLFLPNGAVLGATRA